MKKIKELLLKVSLLSGYKDQSAINNTNFILKAMWDNYTLYEKMPYLVEKMKQENKYWWFPQTFWASPCGISKYLIFKYVKKIQQSIEKDFLELTQTSH